MNKTERAKTVLAMETLARCINDESVFDGWLMCGVADGDITTETTPEEVDEYYLGDDAFRDLMDCFLRRMAAARKSGGLCCDGIVTTEG